MLEIGDGVFEAVLSDVKTYKPTSFDVSTGNYNAFWLVEREFDVGEPCGTECQVGGTGRCGEHPTDEAFASRGADGRQETVPTREVPIRGAGRYADAPGGLAQDDAVRATVLREGRRRLHQGPTQVAVVIGPRGALVRCRHGLYVDIVHIDP